MPVQAPFRAYDANEARKGRSELWCFSDDDIRRAIALVAKEGPTDAQALSILGRHRIVIGSDITVLRPIRIPRACYGVSFVGIGGLFAGDALASLFDVSARAVLFDRISCASRSFQKYFSSFVVHRASAVDTPGQTVLRHCTALNVDRLFVDVTSGFGVNIIDGCVQAELNGSHSAAVEFLSPANRLVNCPSLIDGGGDTVTIGAGASKCFIGGNNLGGGDITSTASSGTNAIVGNTQTGTLTLHASDEEACNT